MHPHAPSIPPMFVSPAATRNIVVAATAAPQLADSSGGGEQKRTGPSSVIDNHLMKLLLHSRKRTQKGDHGGERRSTRPCYLAKRISRVLVLTWGWFVYPHRIAASVQIEGGVVASR